MVLFLRGRSSCGGGAPSRGRFVGFVANGGGGALALAGGGARLFFFLTLLIDGSLPPRRDGGGGADERGAEKVRWCFFIKCVRGHVAACVASTLNQPETTRTNVSPPNVSSLPHDEIIRLLPTRLL